MKRPHFPIGSEIRVRWLDSATTNGWRTLKSDLSPVSIETIGILVTESPTSITISSSITDDKDSFITPLTIPRGCITSIRRL